MNIIRSTKRSFSPFFSGITFSMFAKRCPTMRLKNVTEISTPLQKLIQLDPKVFEYNTENTDI